MYWGTSVAAGGTRIVPTSRANRTFRPRARRVAKANPTSDADRTVAATLRTAMSVELSEQPGHVHERQGALRLASEGGLGRSVGGEA